MAFALGGGVGDSLSGGDPIAPAEITSLAVLPLAVLSHGDNLTFDPETDYFVDGMTEALITELSQIASLRVTSHTSVMRYKGSDKSSSEIGRELNVDHVIEGGVRASLGGTVTGGSADVYVLLLEVATDQILWTESYFRLLRDIVSLQSDVAAAIARELGVTVTPEEAAWLSSARPVDPAAYTAYLRGRSFLRQVAVAHAEGRSVPQDETEALRWFRLAADQGFAAAQVTLGMAYAEGGGGVPQDRVAAHMWLSLAAAQVSTRNRDTYVELRDAVAEEMTPEQIAEAQRLAREWKPAVEP